MAGAAEAVVAGADAARRALVLLRDARALVGHLHERDEKTPLPRSLGMEVEIGPFDEGPLWKHLADALRALAVTEEPWAEWYAAEAVGRARVPLRDADDDPGYEGAPGDAP